MNDKLVIGIIGCGKQSVKHIPALKRLDTRIILADADIGLAKSRSEEFGVEYVGSVDDIFGDPKFAAVDICTPTPTHYSFIESAIRGGKHFFCEKPLASSHEEAMGIEALLEGSGLVGMVGYLYRFHPAFEMVHRCLGDAIIGKPYFATFRLGGRGSHRMWKHRKGEGGGAINEMMVHMLDLVLWYFGKVTDIKPILCETILRTREIDQQMIDADAEDLAMVLLETESGVKAICESDLISPSYMNYMEVQATNGSIITSILDYLPSIVFCKEPRGTYQTGNNIIYFPKVNLFEKQLEYFLNCIANATDPDRNTIKESTYLLEIIDQVRREANGR